MATITKNDIIVGSPVLPDFWLRIIGALDGTTATDIKITGSFEVNGLIIGGVTITVTPEELNRLAGVTPGTVTASKVLVAGAQKNLDELKIGTLTVDQLIMTTPDPSSTAGRLYTYENFI